MPPLPMPPPAQAGEPLGPPHGRALTLLMPTLYQRLRLLARRHLRGERSNHTLDSGALVHEAWLRLAGVPDAAWLEEAAEALGLSYMTARRRWDFARAWMQRELSAA